MERKRVTKNIIKHAIYRVRLYRVLKVLEKYFNGDSRYSYATPKSAK